MPSHGEETTIELRAAIVTLRLFTSKTFKEIGQDLQINSSTCNKIWARAKQRNNGKENITMLEYLKDEPRRGRQPVINDGQL